MSQELHIPAEASGQPTQVVPPGQYQVAADVSATELKLTLKNSDAHPLEIRTALPADIIQAASSPDSFIGSSVVSAAESSLEYDLISNVDTQRSFGAEISTSEPCTWSTKVTNCSAFDGASRKCSDQSISRPGMHLVRYRERSDNKLIHIALQLPGAPAAKEPIAVFEGSSQSKTNIYDRNDSCE